MENDSPNLFDSEAGSVALTVSDCHQPADEGANDDAVEYRTDESADENVVAGDDVDDGGGKEDPSVDRSAEQRLPTEGSDKPKDAPKGLPPGRVKLIMKMDPDVNIVAADAVYLLTKATVGMPRSIRTDNGTTRFKILNPGEGELQINITKIPSQCNNILYIKYKKITYTCT